MIELLLKSQEEPFNAPVARGIPYLRTLEGAASHEPFQFKHLQFLQNDVKEVSEVRKQRFFRLLAEPVRRRVLHCGHETKVE